MYNLIITASIAGVVGGILGYLLRKFWIQYQKKTWETKAAKLLEEAKTKQKEIILLAKDEALKIKEEAEKEKKQKQKYLLELEQKIRHKEDLLERRILDLDKKENELKKSIKEIEDLKSQLKEIRKKQEENLSKIAGLSKEEAKKVLLDIVEKEQKEELINRLHNFEKNFKEEAQKKAAQILSTVIGRYAAEHTAETTVSVVPLPSDEMKGRIIGREGRNIQTLEKITGVDIIIDDTPETVVISSFDPVRRHLAKVVLEKLIFDGRIHPSRIEEVVEKTKKEIAQEILEAGRQAVYEVGVSGLPEEIIKLLGRLKFRLSYGQNVLKHSIEVAYLSAMLAAELGADVAIAKKAGLLHDLGKAIDHEVSGAHHHLSRDVAKKYGLPEEVLHAIEAHHDDIEAKTLEALIVKAADAISGSRPGARRESLESYLKRLTDLENIALSFPGVEKAYAVSAGREIRVIVKPEEVDDLTAYKLAKEIANKIESELEYPGQVKVNVIRETRIIEYAK